MTVEELELIKLKKQMIDLLNWVKSDISQEENPKLGKTSTPYRRDKLKFLYKLESLINHSLKK